MRGNPYTDIARRRWIECLPQWLRPYLYLARIDRPAGIWLLLLPGWWAIILAVGGWRGIDGYTLILMALFALGAVVMRTAGCIVNDLWDRDLDRQVERTRHRPLASGALSVSSAVAFLAALLTIGAAILLQMPVITILLGFLSLPMIGLYPLMKRVTWWPQMFLGLTFNFGALMGWGAVTGRVDLAALCLYAAGIFWTLGYDTVYAHQDAEDDAVAGIKSTARLFGARSKIWVSIFYTMSVLFLCAAGLRAGAGTGYFLVLPFAWAYGMRQVAGWKPEEPPSCLQTFRSAQTFGYFVLAAALLS